MIRSVLSMLVRTGCEQEFERIWQESANQTARRAGIINQCLWHDETERRMFVITSDWDSRAALQEFERSPERIALSAKLEPLRESASKSVLEIVVAV